MGISLVPHDIGDKVFALTKSRGLEMSNELKRMFDAAEAEAKWGKSIAEADLDAVFSRFDRQERAKRKQRQNRPLIYKILEVVITVAAIAAVISGTIYVLPYIISLGKNIFTFLFYVCMIMMYPLIAYILFALSWPIHVANSIMGFFEDRR